MAAETEPANPVEPTCAQQEADKDIVSKEHAEKAAQAKPSIVKQDGNKEICSSADTPMLADPSAEQAKLAIAQQQSPADQSTQEEQPEQLKQQQVNQAPEKPLSDAMLADPSAEQAKPAIAQQSPADQPAQED